MTSWLRIILYSKVLILKSTCISAIAADSEAQASLIYLDISSEAESSRSAWSPNVKDPRGAIIC